MYVFDNNETLLEDWIQKEILPDGNIRIGERGPNVRRVQEWLTLRGYALSIDGEYGPITNEVVAAFQEDTFLEPTGIVDASTFSHLTEPMREALKQHLNQSVSIHMAVLTYAKAHLDEHPREIGGQNCGPWVRLYMNGNDGSQWLWCAGFVSFILHQATESVNAEMPVPGSVSCDTLVAQAKERGLFLSEEEARENPSYHIPPGTLFVMRRTANDWTHVGIVQDAQEIYMHTIEGNTNDDGNREGYEVCARTRSYTNKDYILLTRNG